MKNRSLLLLLTAVSLSLLLLQCLRTSPLRNSVSTKSGAPIQARAASASGQAVAAPVVLPGVALGDGEHTIGPPKILGSLAVFPVYAVVQEQLGEYATLEAALDQGEASVRERGSAASDSAEQAQRSNGSEAHRNNANQSSGGASVNELVIENKGKLPILVLAGTVVKGGRQDRQIGQDFIVGPQETVSVDAFCVEHGRWNANRNGLETQGKFHTAKTLANGEVREAGQYKRDQRRVWSKVGEVNRAHKKAAVTETLLATVDDEAVAEKRRTITRDLLDYFAKVESAQHVVGLAYAVEGKVRGVRWFFDHALFVKHGETLVNTAALDALTAQAQRASENKPEASGACEPQEVSRFVSEVEKGKAEQRETAAQNINEVKEADVGYSSSATLKSPAKKGARAKPITKDFLSK